MNCKRCAALKDQIKSIEEMMKIQGSDGNWNYDPYMHGMLNGMKLIYSVLTDQRPEFLEAPNEWLRDKPKSDALAKEVSL